jgi:hypothetical protein
MMCCVIELADQRLKIVPRAGGFGDDAFYGVVPGLVFVAGQGYEKPSGIKHPTQDYLEFCWRSLSE